MRSVYDRLLPRFAVPETGFELDLDDVFHRRAFRVLEIGCGRGDLVCDHARRFPDRDIVAVDVHTRGIANILHVVGESALTNVRVVEGDALVFLDRVPTGGFDEVWFMFPDPWPKARQRSRRIVRDDVIHRVARIVRPGGVVRTATDVAEYAHHMRGVLAASAWFDGVHEERPDWRIETVFERRGREAGRGPVDLWVARNELEWSDRPGGGVGRD